MNENQNAIDAVETHLKSSVYDLEQIVRNVAKDDAVNIEDFRKVQKVCSDFRDRIEYLGRHVLKVDDFTLN